MNNLNPSRSHREPTRRVTVIAAGALAAAMSLVACSPQGGAPAANGSAVPVPTSQATYPAPAPVAQPGNAPMVATQGQPVPPANGYAANVAPAANYAPAPNAYPAPVNAAPQTYAQAPTYAQPSTYSQAPVYVQQDEVAQPARAAAPARVAPVPVASSRLGEVRSIEPIRTRPQGNGTGAVIGGVLGAVVGNQFGHGGGRAVTTVLGGVGGAVAGNNVERNHREGISGYRISVRLDNGTSRTFTESDAGEYRVGDRVRVDRGQLRPV